MISFYSTHHPVKNSDMGRPFRQAIIALESHKTLPTPERVTILAKEYPGKNSREILDKAFELSESVKIPADPLITGFDPDCPRLSPEKVTTALKQVPKNREWIRKITDRSARRYSLKLPNDPLIAAEKLFYHLSKNVSYWEADAFPLNAMMELENRYNWTFSTDAWSLREQLRREAEVVSQAWKNLLAMSAAHPLLVILNEKTPTDYFTCTIPHGVSVINKQETFLHADNRNESCPIILLTGIKISSSEHRDPLEHTSEGDEFKKAVNFAQKLGRCPVLLDLSRRRFPRSFMRVSRFCNNTGWGIDPKGKVFDPGSAQIPGPKSSQGFAPANGNPKIILFDPWPVSDPEIVSALTQKEQNKFCRIPQTKPWQDDRIGARTEMEANENGVYRVTARAWVVPALGGWMRVDKLFKSRLARFVKTGIPATWPPRK
ncbi:MAG: hypothetical protein GY795_29845 [Desulfobacterales bacterium]|nr:hypothetical protein [Desulfobacterales bacterium]